MLKAVLVQGLLVANVVLANEVKLVLFRLLHRELFTLTPTLPIHSHFALFSQTKFKSIGEQKHVKC